MKLQCHTIKGQAKYPHNQMASKIPTQSNGKQNTHTIKWQAKYPHNQIASKIPTQSNGKQNTHTIKVFGFSQIYLLGLCIFDLFSPKILISREKMNFCIKTRKQAICWIILRKVIAQTKKSINRSSVHLCNPAQLL